MTTESHNTKKPKWQEPTPKQRLSHRSILRFVALADQLARDLSTVLVPENVNSNEMPLGVYFVSADRHSQPQLQPYRKKDDTPIRYYNLRLLYTFRLVDRPGEEKLKKLIGPAWDWIKDNYKDFEPLFEAAQYLEGHSRDHYALFVKCIEELTGNDQLKSVISERFRDLLDEVIAAMPYTDQLPSALDGCLNNKSGEMKPIKSAWDWLKVNSEDFEPRFEAAQRLEGPSRDHYALLSNCIEETIKIEQREVEIAKQIHDLLVEAIAAMPYTGLLPSALDKRFYGKGWQRDKTDPVRFHLKYEEKKVHFSNSVFWLKWWPREKVTLFEEVDKLIHHAAFGTNPNEEATYKDKSLRLGKLYVKDFINWFTLGYTPEPRDRESGSYNQSPYKPESKDLQGFAMPIYHFHDRAGNPVGGFEGWAVVQNSGTNPVVRTYKKAFARIHCNRDAVTLAIRAFSRRIREERMRELIEKEWLATSDRRTFTLQHFQEYDGWIVEDRNHEELPTLEEYWLFGFLIAIETTDDNGDFKQLVFTLYDQDNGSNIEEITHIAVLPPSDRNRPSPLNAVPLLFRKREDTILPGGHDDLVDYGFHITQAIGQIYNAARLKEKAMETATQVLAKDFAHQVQHIAGALSSGWIIKESSFHKLLETSPETGHLDVRVAPLPILYKYADEVLVLWSTQRASDLYDQSLLSNPCLPLSAIFSVAARCAKSEWIAFRAKSYALHLAGRIAEVQHCIEEGERLEFECNFSQIATVALQRETSQESNDKLLAYARLLEALVFNSFRHGSSPVAVIWKRADPQEIWLQNKFDDQCGPSNDGEAVIQNLAKHAGVNVSAGKCKDGYYSRNIINTSTPWIIS